MIAAIYARKSNEQTGVSEEARSVARQVMRCRECADRHRWTIAEDHIYVDDGISGADFTARAAFLRLMNPLKPKPRFDVLIMTELSRLGREQIQTSGALFEITSAGVKVWFAHDDRECPLDTAMDKAILTFQTFGAELEREKASIRTYDAMRRKAELGHVTGGRTFGYRNVDVLGDPDVHGRRKRLYVIREIEENEAAVVRRVFEMHAAGRGLTTIAKTLNSEKALCPRPFRGQPAGWAPSSVREVLYRPDYHGKRRWGKSEKRYRSGRKQQRDRPETDWLWIDMPQWRIVPEDLWQRVHARLDQVRTYSLRLSKGRLAAGPPPIELTTGRRPKGDGGPHLLTGIARCTCGSGLEAFRRPWQDVHFYYCAATGGRGARSARTISSCR
jgi:site-specific DNA recombinase